MVHRPSFLHALTGAVAGLVLTSSLVPGPAAAAPALKPPEPGPPAAGTSGTGDTGARAAEAGRGQRKARQDEYDAPLAITIDELTPGALPRRGPVVVQGTVTNVDLDTWRGIALYPMINAGPGCETCPGVITTSAELADAAATDPEAPVGVRYTDVRDGVASLAPGESATYTLRIPQRALRELLPSPAAGVYWFGVHASGESRSTPRDVLADGRARTFLPYVPDGIEAPVETAVVVPLRDRITHTADGRLRQERRWVRSLSPSGELGGPLAFGAASGSDPVTWLVDPAVPDAVRHLARGNAPRAVEAVPDEPQEPQPSDDPTSETPDDGAGAAADDGAEPTVNAPLVRAAERWLREAQLTLTGDEIALLPYGDMDVAAAADALPGLYDTAREHPSQVLAEWEVEGSPIVAPPNGYVDESAIEVVEDGATVLAGDQMFPSETLSAPTPAAAVAGTTPIVFSSTGAASGGPGPDPRLAPIALRQRILSEAALRVVQAGDDTPEPLVVLMPTGVDAVGAGAFWDGLDLDWLELTDLDTVVGGADLAIDPGRLDHPEEQELLEVDGSVLVEVNRLIRASRSLQSILGDQYRISGQLLDEALAGASYALRGDEQAGVRLARTRSWVQDQLGELSVDAPSGVTLSGTSGSFGVAVSNGLEHPVTVRIEATTDSGAQIGVANPVALAPNSRSSVRIDAEMTDPGVHNVTLRLTDLDGNPIGADDHLPIRSGQVGVVIWAVIGTGAGILFLAIGIRLFRRIRSRDDRDPASAATGSDEEPGDAP